MEDERNYADECGDHGGRNNSGEPCGRAAGWGTDNDTGRCRNCLGTSEDGSSHEDNDFAEGNSGGGASEGNTNATTHGGYTDEHSFYENELDEPLQNLAGDIFDDYLKEYKDRHGRDPPKGLEMELERLSISHVKDIVLDQWANDKPESLGSGNPLVDRETKRDFNPEDGSVVIEKYKESVVLQAQKKLSTDRRQWLKDLGLLDNPESQKADAMEGSLEFTLSPEDKEDLEQRYDAEPET